MMLASIFYYGLTALSCAFCWMFKDRLYDMQHLPSSNLTEFESQVVGRTIGYAYYCFVGSIAAATVHLGSSFYWMSMHKNVQAAVGGGCGNYVSADSTPQMTPSKPSKTLRMRTVLLLAVVQPYLWGLTFPCFAYVCYDFAYTTNNIFVHQDHSSSSLLNQASTFFWASICTLATLLFQIVLGHIWAIQRTTGISG